MNIFICKCLLGCEVSKEEVFIVFDEYVNIVLVGLVIVFGFYY